MRYLNWLFTSAETASSLLAGSPNCSVWHVVSASY